MSILNNLFIVKYNFYENIIPQYTLVNYITSINDMCLVENVITKNRVWCNKYDIYPLCKNKLDYDNYGCWIYNKIYNDIADNK